MLAFINDSTVHKHRNLLAHAPERLHEEIAADSNDMIYAATRRKAFIRKWRLKHPTVADSLEEARERLFTFTRLPPSQWRSARTTNAIEWPQTLPVRRPSTTSRSAREDVSCAQRDPSSTAVFIRRRRIVPGVHSRAIAYRKGGLTK